MIQLGNGASAFALVVVVLLFRSGNSGETTVVRCGFRAETASTAHAMPPSRSTAPTRPQKQPIIAQIKECFGIVRNENSALIPKETFANTITANRAIHQYTVSLQPAVKLARDLRNRKGVSTVPIEVTALLVRLFLVDVVRSDRRGSSGEFMHCNEIKVCCNEIKV